MIYIVIKKEKKEIKRVLVKGHADFADAGQDIVCSSVSSMIMLAINIITSIDESAIKYYKGHSDDGQPLIEIKKTGDNENVNKILETLIVMLNDLASNYPQNIKIRNEE